jgi:hypothetical protein
MSGGIASGTSLVLEGRIATGAGVFVICSQSERLAAALESAVARVACGIISSGVAGDRYRVPHIVHPRIVSVGLRGARESVMA